MPTRVVGGVARAAKVVLALALVGAGGAIAFAGALPEGAKAASDVLADPARYEGRDVELKGSVLEGTLVRGDTIRFLLGDGGRAIEVVWDPALPLPDHEAGGTIEGKNVVVHGIVARDAAGEPYLLAHDMAVGCASKYEPNS